MKKASLVVNYHLNNKIFDINDRNVNRDDCGYSIWLLREMLRDLGYDLATCDINSPNDSELIIYFDFPSESVVKLEGIQILCLFENEIIKPTNSPDCSDFTQFDYILTWNDAYVERYGYIKFNYTHKLIRPYRFDNFKDRKLCTLISANKMATHEYELYSERIAAIRWFEQNAPEDFDLYGIEWDRVVNDGGLISRVLKKFDWTDRLFADRYPSYKGRVESKKEVFANYKFSICYENAKGYRGYISEKIFDSMMGGCVPIYLGAPNVSEYVPRECYIDFNDFENYQELYTHINGMTDSKYLEYIKNIQRFLNGAGADQFEASSFAKIIIGCVEGIE